MRILWLLPLLGLLTLPAAAEEKIDTVFRVYDADGDGVLSREEVPDEGIFTKADKDGDGKITRMEIAAYLGIAAPPPKEGKGAGGQEKPAGAPAKKAPEGKPEEGKSEAGMEKEPRTIRERVEDFFRRFDKDQNRKVSKEEFQAGQEVFETYDRGRDGTLNEREVTRYIRDVIREAKRRPTPDNFFDLWDMDRDQKVTSKEYDGPGDFFRMYDHDKNNVVTLDELNMGPEAGRMREGDAKFMADGPTAVPRTGLAERFDANKDGRVTLEELGGSESVLARLDRNGDGVLTGAELK